ncbi:sensor histidine kinase [Streptomyces indicus]|uniref:histidine kinase n=1 Tax=Streptomyces indicus TaxID=417292 RepID=A0A1G8ZJI2_9ACTN|nr:HAMP domain-containing sensor histidine kinase [Streptomyces indicus]SDK15178.1 two-component system, OmpR family, sensor kinase [Streptomyces indicus]
MKRLGQAWTGGFSLRARLVAITLGLLVAALLASTGLLVAQLQRHLVGQLDERVAGVAAVAARLPTLPDVVGEEAPRVRDAVERQLVKDVYVAYAEADGTVRWVIGPTGAAPPDLDPARFTAPGGEPVAVSARDGQEWRAVAVPRTAGEGTVIAAGSLAGVEEALHDLTRRVLLIDGIVLVALGVAGWYAVRAGLRPLRRVETTATAIAGGDLTRRVPELAGARTELGRLATALNGMLDRIEAGDAARDEAERRMRRFLADISHELRTPLAGIKGFTELYRMGGMPRRADVDASMGRIEREAARLVDLVEELLLLARLDDPSSADPLPLQRTPMDLRTLAADALHDLRALDPRREVTLTGVDGGPQGGAPVLGDEARLRQVTSNLVGNAIAHTPAGTPVRIGVGTQGAFAVLEFADQGPGMTAEQADRAFDRLYRGDRSRGRTAAQGAGLGLAIVDSLVRAHGGRVELRTAPGEGATFKVLLPLHHGD